MHKSTLEFFGSKPFMFTATGLLVVLLCTYAYLVNLTVRNVVSYKSTLREIMELKSTVAEYEVSFIKMTSSFSLSKIESIGLARVQTPVYESLSSLKNVQVGR